MALLRKRDRREDAPLAEDSGERGLQARLEAGPAGRALVSGLILLLLASIVVGNLPDSRLKAVASHGVDTVRDRLGIEQAWGVFAPDPRNATFDLRARIAFSDGTTRVWRVPGGNPFLATYRDYRWQKWSEAVRRDDREALWRPFAVWVARDAARDGRTPTEVVLVRRWYDLFPPGPGRSRGPWNEFVFLRLRVTPDVLRPVR